MDKIILKPTFLKGSLTPPPSKSVAHRALICSALKKGETYFPNISFSEDILATIDALKALGVSFKENKIISNGLLTNSSVKINAGESGSTLRFFIPISIALNNKSVFFGKGRLPQRPLTTFFTLFEEEKIKFKTPQGEYLPLEIYGTFHSTEVEVEGDVSSQFITGLLFGAVLSDNLKTIKVRGKFESKPYVDLTVDVLNSFGYQIKEENNVYTIGEFSKKNIEQYKIESDFSQAAFFLCGGVINGDITLKNINLSSKQGDKAIIEIIKKFGGKIEVSEDVVTARKSSLKGIEIDASDIPDLVPILATLACYADGKTTIYNASRVRLKECDRLDAMETELSKMGATIKSSHDTLEIHGCSLKGALVNSHNDHRIAMALAIASIGASGETTICDFRAINKSYSNFFNDFKSLGGNIVE